jgi:hypothetical protein
MKLYTVHRSQRVHGQCEGPYLSGSGRASLHLTYAGPATGKPTDDTAVRLAVVMNGDVMNERTLESIRWLDV